MIKDDMSVAASVIGGQYCARIKVLTDDQLDWLITASPFASDVLAHATVCPDCSGRIELLEDHLWSGLPGEEQTRLDEWAARFGAQMSPKTYPQTASPKTEGLWARCIVFLKDVTRRLDDPIPVLGPASQASDIRTIMLRQAFGADAATLQHVLPWVGETMDIVRTFVEPAHRAVYSIYVNSATVPVHDISDVCLLVVLRGDGMNRATALLTWSHTEAIAEGSQLPDNPDAVVVELCIKRIEAARENVGGNQ